jgi:hypothetical protein
LNGRQLLRPLPMFLIALFVTVAVADFVRTKRAVPPPPPQLLGTAVLRFEAVEPVVDFRLRPVDEVVEVLPSPRLAAGQWSAPSARGVWANGPAASLEIDLTVGGHRVLVLDCLPARGKPAVASVRVQINGADCGELELRKGLQRQRLALPPEVLHPGPNAFVFDFPDVREANGPRRGLLVRRLGLFLDESAGVDKIDGRPPVSVDVAGAALVVRHPGTVELPFTLDDRTDALQMRYRFPTEIGRAEVEVAKLRGDGPVGEVILERSVSAGHERAGRVRFPLHGRRGEFVFRLRTDFEPVRPGLRISSLQLIEEGHFSRASNPKDGARRRR